MHQENLQHGLKKSMSPSQWDITIYFLFSFVLLSLRFIKHLPFLFSFARFFCPLVLTSSRSCCTVCTSAHGATAMISKGLINTRHFHVHYHDHYLIVVEIFIYIYFFFRGGGICPWQGLPWQIIWITLCLVPHPGPDSLSSSLLQRGWTKWCHSSGADKS